MDRNILRLMARLERRRAGRKKPRVRKPTDRQRAFIEAFLWDARGNATEAARMVGYRWPSKVGPALVYHPLINPIINARVGLMLAAAKGPLRAGMLTFE